MRERRSATPSSSSKPAADREPFESIEDYQDYVGRLGTYSPTGRVIASGEAVLVFSLERVEGNEDLWALVNDTRFGAMTFAACYCSVFGECWTSDLQSFDKRPVRSCAVSEDAWQG